MHRNLHEGIIQIRNGVVNFYLLHDPAGVYLIDSGFFFGGRHIERALDSLGRPLTNIKLVLITHGHLDHVANLRWIKESTGATILGLESEKSHVRGVFPYRGFSRVCGWLEAIGRAVIRYSPVELDGEFVDGQVIDVWGGLEVVHLPGHTQGHCGFFSRRTGFLFSGDLFVNRRIWTKLPPFVLNSCPKLFPQSCRRVFDLNPSGILANHCDKASPEHQLRRFRRKFRRFARPPNHPPRHPGDPGPFDDSRQFR